MIRTLIAAAGISAAATGAQAITLGPITFAEDAFADDVALANGAPSNTDFTGLLGSSNQTVANIGTSNNSPDIEVIFTDNVVVNGTGIDLFIYVPGEVAAVVASMSAAFDAATTMQASQANLVSETFFDAGNPFFFNPNSTLLALNLDDLGVAAGAEVSSVFLRRGDIEGGIYGVGAFNSRSVLPHGGGGTDNGPSPVPLPAGLPLLALGLAGLGVVRRWR